MREKASSSILQPFLKRLLTEITCINGFDVELIDKMFKKIFIFLTVRRYEVTTKSY